MIVFRRMTVETWLDPSTVELIGCLSRLFNPREHFFFICKTNQLIEVWIASWKTVCDQNTSEKQYVIITVRMKHMNIE